MLPWTKRDDWSYSFSMGYLGLDDEPWVEEAAELNVGGRVEDMTTVLLLVGTETDEEGTSIRWDVEITPYDGEPIHYVTGGRAQSLAQAKELCEAVMNAVIYRETKN